MIYVLKKRLEKDFTLIEICVINIDSENFIASFYDMWKSILLFITRKFVIKSNNQLDVILSSYNNITSKKG